MAQVSKRTFYQHFTSKDELIAEHLRRFDPDILPEVFDRTDLTPRERLLAAFDIHAPLCPFIAAAVEIHDPGHPPRVHAARLQEGFRRAAQRNRARGRRRQPRTARRTAGAAAGWRLGPNRVLNTETFATAGTIAAVLIDNAIPDAAVPPDAGGSLSTGTGPRAGCGDELSRS